MTLNLLPQDVPPVYNLFAISQHSGSLGGGHYTATVQYEGRDWYEFNDSGVSRVDDMDPADSAHSAYVLFYRRQDDLRSSPSKPMNFGPHQDFCHALPSVQLPVFSLLALTADACDLKGLQKVMLQCCVSANIGAATHHHPGWKPPSHTGSPWAELPVICMIHVVTVLLLAAHTLRPALDALAHVCRCQHRKTPTREYL